MSSNTSNGQNNHQNSSGRSLPIWTYNLETGRYLQATSEVQGICRDFLWGICSLNGKCIYRHERDYESMKAILRFCHDYQNKAGCMRPECTYLHASREEESKFLKYGVIPRVLAERYASNMNQAEAPAGPIPSQMMNSSKYVLPPPPPPPNGQNTGPSSHLGPVMAPQMMPVVGPSHIPANRMPDFGPAPMSMKKPEQLLSHKPLSVKTNFHAVPSSQTVVMPPVVAPPPPPNGQNTGPSSHLGPVMAPQMMPVVGPSHIPANMMSDFGPAPMTMKKPEQLLSHKPLSVNTNFHAVPSLQTVVMPPVVAPPPPPNGQNTGPSSHLGSVMTPQMMPVVGPSHIPANMMPDFGPAPMTMKKPEQLLSHKPLSVKTNFHAVPSSQTVVMPPVVAPPPPPNGQNTGPSSHLGPVMAPQMMPVVGPSHIPANMMSDFGPAPMTMKKPEQLLSHKPLSVKTNFHAVPSSQTVVMPPVVAPPPPPNGQNTGPSSHLGPVMAPQMMPVVGPSHIPANMMSDFGPAPMIMKKPEQLLSHKPLSVKTNFHAVPTSSAQTVVMPPVVAPPPPAFSTPLATSPPTYTGHQPLQNSTPSMHIASRPNAYPVVSNMALEQPQPSTIAQYIPVLFDPNRPPPPVPQKRHLPSPDLEAGPDKLVKSNYQLCDVCKLVFNSVAATQQEIEILQRKHDHVQKTYQQKLEEFDMNKVRLRTVFTPSGMQVIDEFFESAIQHSLDIVGESALFCGQPVVSFHFLAVHKGTQRTIHLICSQNSQK